MGCALARGQRIGVAGVEREEGAPILQEHAGVAGHDRGTELVIRALDHGHGIAVRVGRHDSDRVAVGWRPPDRHRGTARDATAATGQPGRIEAALHGHRDDRRIGEVAVAILERELGGLDDDVDIVGVVEVGHVEAFEQGEDGEGGKALGRRREARRLAVAITHAERLDPVGAVLGEVGKRERTADGAGAGHDAAGEVTAIERLAAAVGHRGQRGGEIGLHELPVGEAIRVVHGPERAPDLDRRRGAEERAGVGGDAALTRRDGEPVACVTHGVLEESLPRNR